jgi:adenosylcobinamide kinase / adenosylcobinamide-phosphate guanylyltransferase
MKTLFIGGVKSGKSRLAEDYILKINAPRHYYLATTEFIDDEMQRRIAEHKARRQERFITLEEPIRLVEELQQCPGPVLVECISMWLNNMLHHNNTDDLIFSEIEQIMRLPQDLVFVQNEVGLGIIPDNALARQYVDLSGKVAQYIAHHCGRVFFCCAGQALALK